MPKKSKTSKTDNMLTLFQNKIFTLIFFLEIFTLLGGMFYLMQTSAATRVSVRGCNVSGTVGKNAGGMVVGAYIDTRYLGGGSVTSNGKFSFMLSDLDKYSNQIVVTYGTQTKGGPLATITAGPCL